MSNICWLGTQYGGFYVDITRLTSDAIVYSFGVGEDITFDLSLIEKTHCTIYAYDPTPKSIRFAEKNKNPNFIFNPIGLSHKDGLAQFFLPKNKDHVSGSLFPVSNVDLSNSIIVEFKCISTLLKENQHTHIDLLKMDIEGSEYDVIKDLVTNNIEINQLAIEFHKRGATSEKESSIELLKKLKLTVSAVSRSGNEYLFVKDTQ